MLTRWLASLTLLAAALTDAVVPERERLTLGPTSRVKVHSGTQLTLNCGDRRQAGVVQYWHTPDGDLHSHRPPGIHGNLDPVVMWPDGSLVMSNTSGHHSGLYFCLLQGAEGMTLWPYNVQVTPVQDIQTNPQNFVLKRGSQSRPGARRPDGFLDLHDPASQDTQQDSSYREVRHRRDVSGFRAEENRQEGVSDVHFAAAVAASVVVTFVVGFSAGALSRAHVLRCLGVATKRMQSLRQRRQQTETADRGCEVTMTTLPPMYDNEAFDQELDDASDNNEALNATTDTTVSTPTSPSPPAKPQRSFRHKREEQPETAAYLEGCDPKERGGDEEKEAGRTQEGERGSDGEAEEERQSSSLSGDGGSKSVEMATETDEERSEGGEKEGRRDRREEKEEKGEEQAGRTGEEREEGKEGRGSSIRASEDSSSDSQESSEDTEDEEKGSGKQEEGKKNSSGGGDESEAAACSPTSRPQPARRSRVIRLYQYDEEGQRYSHLASPAPDEPVSAPRLKQRSLSLTRLNAIMAAASGGPMDSPNRETDREEREERPLFHMEI